MCNSEAKVVYSVSSCEVASCHSDPVVIGIVNKLLCCSTSLHCRSTDHFTS